MWSFTSLQMFHTHTHTKNFTIWYFHFLWSLGFSPLRDHRLQQFGRLLPKTQSDPLGLPLGSFWSHCGHKDSPRWVEGLHCTETVAFGCRQFCASHCVDLNAVSWDDADGDGVDVLDIVRVDVIMSHHWRVVASDRLTMTPMDSMQSPQLSTKKQQKQQLVLVFVCGLGKYIQADQGGFSQENLDHICDLYAENHNGNQITWSKLRRKHSMQSKDA